MFRKWFLPRFIYWFYRLWSSTWRVQIIEPLPMQEALKNKTPFILAHWHGDELALLKLSSRYSIATMTSTSKDGELMNYVLQKQGAKTSRGSSTRGGVSALKGLIRLMKEGSNATMAVDGPKGPLHKVKPGIFELSRLSKSPIFVGGVACKNKIVFKKSWNKAILPYPFTRVVITWSEPFSAISKEQDPRDQSLAQDLESSLYTAHQQALKFIVED